jgi:hypothetical protein
MFANRLGRNEQTSQRTFHRCFLPSFGSFGQVVSEEKICKNWSIRNKNCLWWPYLLMDRDKMCNLLRGPSIDASYQVSVHLAEGFQRRRLKCEKLTDAKWCQKLALARWARNNCFFQRNKEKVANNLDLTRKKEAQQAKNFFLIFDDFFWIDL